MLPREAATVTRYGADPAPPEQPGRAAATAAVTAMAGRAVAGTISAEHLVRWAHDVVGFDVTPAADELCCHFHRYALTDDPDRTADDVAVLAVARRLADHP